jgi:hypothetical protein
MNPFCRTGNIGLHFGVPLVRSVAEVDGIFQEFVDFDFHKDPWLPLILFNSYVFSALDGAGCMIRGKARNK